MEYGRWEMEQGGQQTLSPVKKETGQAVQHPTSNEERTEIRSKIRRGERDQKTESISYLSFYAPWR
jgi:hypothetical protein